MAFSLNPRPSTTTSNCLCHKPGVQGPLTDFSDVSWRTFKEASDLRKDEVSQKMEGQWENGPFGVYHRNCYQTYTAKNLLERVAKKRKTENISTADNRNSAAFELRADSRSTRSSLLVTDMKKCAICQSEKTDGKDRRRKEKLTLCETMQAGTTLLKVAKFRGDERLIVALSGQDPIAIELSYHRTCYRSYTNAKQIEVIEKNHEGKLESCYDDAFQALRSEMEPKLFERLEVLRMSDLRQRYVELLSLQGIQNPLYRSEKLKVRMQKSYLGRISFWHPRYRSEAEIVYCDEVSKGQIVECGLNRSSESEIFVTEPGDVPSKNHVYHVAKSVRAALLSQEPNMPWPMFSSNIEEENIMVPTVVYNLLAWILSEGGEGEEQKQEKVNVQGHCQRLVLSLAQDLLYNVSNGRQKTPKHVSLPLAVKNLTGSKEVITLLNRYGHGISYDQVLEIETRLAENVFAEREHGVILPKAVSPNVFSIFCWDNIDLLEETLSGRGTTHCTNGIVVQRQVSGCALPPTVLQKKAARRRSFRAVPSQIHEYNAGKRCGPGEYAVDPTLHSTADYRCKAMTMDFGWFLSRLPNPSAEMTDSRQTVPGWSGFNAVASDQKIPPKSAVGYCQLIDASPTELSTVYTLLKNSLEMATQLGLDDTVVVLDQAIYAKAIEVVWKQKEEFKSIVLRMGSFHIMCVFLSVIGKRFRDSGLRDLLLESALVGSGSLNGVLEGKHYNRALRTHKVVLEALFRLSWQTFVDERKDDPEVQLLRQAVVTATTKVRKELTSITIEELYGTPELQGLQVKYEEFNKGSSNKMSSYWQSYIEMVSLLLCFIRSIREGDWNLHLACIRDMLPWMFAYDRTNYSRYLPVYWCDMMSLRDEHPSTYEAFQAGDFVVQRSGNAFSQVAVDQTIEQTINRDTKSKGGIVGFSLNKGAVQRWLLTSHERAAITQACRQMAGLSATNDESVVKEKGRARMLVDENDVKKVQSTLNSWVNPFLPSDTDELCHLASGMTASKKVEEDLLRAHDKGKEALTTFIRKRLMTTEVSFYDPIPKLKLASFDSMSLSSVKIGGKEVMMKADRDLFARLLVVAQTREMDLREVFKYSLGPLPWSLASTDGSLCKTVKSKLLESLVDGVEPAEDVPPTAALIVDGMAILQSMREIPATFEELATAVFDSVVPQRGLARRVDFVTDRYPNISIKNPERTKRASQGAVKVKITGAGQKCPKQWKKFLSSGENKRALTRFLLQQWSSDSFADRIRNRNIYFAIEDKCFRLSVIVGKVVCEEIPELNSNHEEADTKLLLHAKHASENGEASIVIKSPDTDVAILACHFCKDIPARILIMKKEKTRNIFLEISAIADAAGAQLCDALPGLHAFTGCDSTSAFSGKGKKNALKLCKLDTLACGSMAALGDSFDLETVPFRECEKFVCQMYGRLRLTDVNECRYVTFCAKQGLSQSLPPCQDALRLHTLRANYQAAIWRHALVANPEVPPPQGHGWLITDDQLDINWMSLPPAPEALLELILCGCTKDCTTGHCTCKRNGVSCAESCQCGNACENPYNYVQEDGAEDSEEDGEL